MKRYRRLILGGALCLAAAMLLVLGGCGQNNPANLPVELTGIFPTDGGTQVPVTTAIEMTFSVPVREPEEFFAISPKVEGKLEVLGGTLVFIPAKDTRLAINTLYTITVKAGIKARDGSGTLAEGRSFSFTTAPDGDVSRFTPRHPWESFLPSDLPVIDLNFYDQGEGAPAETTFDVTVHRLKSATDYLNFLCKGDKYGLRVNTSDLPQVVSFSQTVAAPDGKGEDFRDIILPDLLEAGWYVATATDTQKKYPPTQKLLQVSDMAVYTQASNGEALVWLNSAKTGQAVEKATLKLTTDPFAKKKPEVTAQTQADGTVFLDLPESNPESDEFPDYYYTFEDKEGVLFCDKLQAYPYQDDAEFPIRSYYGFLYTDRTIYRQSDTIKFWGLAYPRKAGTQALPKLRVELRSGNSTEAIQTAQVEVSDQGVFSGSFDFQNLNSGSVEIAVYPVDAKQSTHDRWVPALCSQYLSIAQYKKPLYTGSITTDKLYYQPGESVNALVTMSLYDRTPAGGLPLLMEACGADPQRKTTDEEGKIALTIAPRMENDSWRPMQTDITAGNDGAADVNVTLHTPVYLFNTRVMMEAQVTGTKESPGITVTTNQIDFGKLPKGGQLVQEYETLRGAPTEAEISISITKTTYTKEALEPYYDRYNKVSIPRVRYLRTEEPYKTLTKRSVGGQLVLTDLVPAPQKDVSYSAIVSTSTGGVTQTQYLSLGEQVYHSDEERQGRYHTFDIQSRDRLANRYQGKGYYSSSYVRFDYGEELPYSLLENGQPVTQGSLLTAISQNKTSTVTVSQRLEGTILCGEELLPNFLLNGAYFDGKHIFPVNPSSLAVNPESRQLNMAILPDKDDYRPGETAKVTLKVTDQGGKPVSANVCLGVVDESIFAVAEQYVNMGDNLYNGVYYNEPLITASYIQHGVNIYYGGGGKGGGGGGGESISLRENFKDTIDVFSGKTATDGTIAFTFPMPENLTQWRLTALASDQKMYYAQGRSQLYTTLPFRVDPISCQVFLTGDTISTTLRSFGTGISTQDEVVYTVTIEGAPEERTQTKTALAGQSTPISLGSLTPGSYALVVTGRCKEYQDGVRLPFTVRDTALTFPIQKTLDLSKGLTIHPTSYPVEVTVYNEDYAPFMMAWSIMNQDSGKRGDAKLAQAGTAAVMSDFFGPGYRPAPLDLTQVQLNSMDSGKGLVGGVQLFPYSEPDVQTTARAMVGTPTALNIDRATNFLRSAYEGQSEKPLTQTEKAAALMGIAASGSITPEEEQDLRSRLASQGSSSRETQYLIAGLSYLNMKDAQKAYAKLLAPTLQKGDKSLYLKAATPYDTIDATAGAMACAVLTGSADDAALLLNYLNENSTTRFGTMRGPCQLECALFLNRFQPKNPQMPTLRYNQKGEAKTLKLGKGKSLHLTLTQEELAAVDLKVEDGVALADVRYTGTPEELDFTPSPHITVTKTMDTVEAQKRLGGVTTITVKVTVDGSMPYGDYQITDWIPSNMRLQRVIEDPKQTFSWEQNQQLMNISFSLSPHTGRSFTFRYTATSVLDAQCVLEHTYAFCSDTMEGGRTEKGDFLPSDYYYLGVGYLFRKN